MNQWNILGVDGCITCSQNKGKIASCTNQSTPKILRWFLKMSTHRRGLTIMYICLCPEPWWIGRVHTKSMLHNDADWLLYSRLIHGIHTETQTAYIETCHLKYIWIKILHLVEKWVIKTWTCRCNRIKSSF